MQIPKRFENKVAIVTGGNSGIGRGISLQLVAEGASVIMIARDAEKAHNVLKEIADLGGEGHFIAADLSEPNNIQHAVDAAIEHAGKLHVLVNNIGFGTMRCSVTEGDTPAERWQQLRSVNLDATYYMSAYCLPWLAKQSDPAIVNISSTATLHGNWGLYGAAKSAVEGLTRSFAAEAANRRIRVNCVSPGWIATGGDEAKKAAGSKDGQWDLPPSLLNRMGSPKEIAQAVCFLASPDASFITGQTLVVDGGLSIIDYPSLPMLARSNNCLYSAVGEDD